MGAPPTAVPGGALVLGLRGVDVKSLAERLRAVGSVRLPRQRERGRRALSELGSLGAREGPRYVWVTAADGVDDAAVARRARALSPAVVVLAFDASSQASFEAILRWDRALTSDLPVMWAALVAPDRRRAVSTTDIRNTLYCRGALHRPVVEVDTAAKLFRADVEAKRIAEAVVRYTSRSSIDSSPRGSLDSSRASAQYNRTRPEHGGFGWNLIRQCL